jgi:phosphoribosylaminoimidazole-succinocarboxamide synthase
MLTCPKLPELTLLHRGKVRDSFRIDDTRRLIVVTDRISAFDLKIKTPIAQKGEVLNRLAAFWFQMIDAEAARGTMPSIAHHMLEVPDPQAMLVREAQPIRVEMIVRGAISGSMWRGYVQGKREFSGVRVGDGLRENEQLPEPIVTPSTKEASDREIAPVEILELGLASARHYEAMHEASKALFRLGHGYAERKGLVLADTKYEFGLAHGALCVIDEVHTADCSRFWDAESYAKDPARAVSFDKEYVRQWMLEHRSGDALPTELPAQVAAETAQRYCALFERLTGEPIVRQALAADALNARLRANLERRDLLPIAPRQS